MNVTNLALANDQRQCGKKRFLVAGKCLACPFQRRARCLVEISAGLLDRFVVIALENHCAFRGVASDRVDDCARVGAVADEITEEREPLGTVFASVFQAGIQGFQVPVDIADQSTTHRKGPPRTPVAVGILTLENSAEALHNLSRID